MFESFCGLLFVQRIHEEFFVFLPGINYLSLRLHCQHIYVVVSSSLRSRWLSQTHCLFIDKFDLFWHVIIIVVPTDYCGSPRLGHGSLWVIFTLTFYLDIQLTMKG